MKHRLYTYVLFPFFFLIIWSCSPEERQHQIETQPSTPAPAGQTLVYDCLEEWDIVVKVDTSDAWLFLQDTTVHLPRARSASGARFMTASGDYMYWSKGDDAIIQVDNQSYGYCDLDQEEAVWQDAKLRGADFRAAGNEPGWYLEIFPDSTRYVLDYGERTIKTPTPEPEEFPDEKESIYEIETEAHFITIRQTGESCNLASGKEFASTVYLTVDGKEYRGCGRSFQ